MNISELKAEIVRNGMTLEDLSKEMGLSMATIHRKVNAKKEFTMSEIKLLMDILHLSDEKMKTIFFS